MPELIKPPSFEEWFRSEVENYLGLQPTSVSPQPVHVLNGFLDTWLEGSTTPRLAIDLVATKQGGWKQSAERVLASAGEVRLPESEDDLDEVRTALASLIAADRVVFHQFASFQIAHPGVVTRDRTQFGLGTLAARLAMHAQSRDDVVQLVSRLTSRQPNPHWIIQAVLSPSEVRDQVVDELPATPEWWGETKQGAQLADDLGAFLRRCIRLAGNGTADSLLALHALAIGATLSGLIAFAQVPALEVRKNLFPLLCEVGPVGSLPGVRDASASSFAAVGGLFEEWLVRLFQSTVGEYFKEEPAEDEAVVFLEQWERYALSGRGDAESKVREIFQTWRHSREPREAIAHTLQDLLISDMGNKPRKFFAAVGRHCGFVGPRRSYPPRFRIDVTLIPALVIAGIDEEDGEIIRFSDWLNRLASRYGIFVGTSLVAEESGTPAPRDELERNQRNLADLLSAVGLARRYSDGVTEILNPLVLWSRN